MPEPEKIEWIGGYPRVEGVNVPPATQSADPLEQKLLDDVVWEAQHQELHGWAKVQAFINRILGD